MYILKSKQVKVWGFTTMMDFRRTDERFVVVVLTVLYQKYPHIGLRIFKTIQTIQFLGHKNGECYCFETW